MKLYLLRHAERGHGEEQDQLTEMGIEQSNHLIHYLNSLHLNKIICANTNRARKTIEPFLKKFNISTEYTSLVNEQELGDLFGKSGAEYREQLQKSGLSKEEFRPKNGENYFDLMNRAKEFLEIMRKEKNQNILISTHAGFIRSVIILLLNLPKEKLVFDPVSLTSIEFDDYFNIIQYKLNEKII